MNTVTTKITTINGTYPTFKAVALALGKEITSVHGNTRAAKFDELYTEYSFNDGVLTLTSVHNKTTAIRLQDLFLTLRDPDLLPIGNGQIDKVIDGKAGEEKNTVKYLQTAADYLTHALNEHADVQAIYTLVNQPAKTNEQLKAIIEAVKAVLLPQVQADTYAALVNSEAAIDKLSPLGFTFEGRSCWYDKEGIKTFKGTITQADITANGPAIALLINVIGQPAAKTTGDLFAGTLSTAFDVTFQLK